MKVSSDGSRWLTHTATLGLVYAIVRAVHARRCAQVGRVYSHAHQTTTTCTKYQHKMAWQISPGLQYMVLPPGDLIALSYRGEFELHQRHVVAAPSIWCSSVCITERTGTIHRAVLGNECLLNVIDYIRVDIGALCFKAREHVNT